MRFSFFCFNQITQNIVYDITRVSSNLNLESYKSLLLHPRYTYHIQSAIQPNSISNYALYLHQDLDFSVFIQAVLSQSYWCIQLHYYIQPYRSYFGIGPQEC